jgi:hypothetical protein
MHVKMIEYRNVCGKCQTCADLSDLLKKSKSECELEELKNLHVLHRSAYMGERLYYYEHLGLALRQPTKYGFFIMDKYDYFHLMM